MKTVDQVITRFRRHYPGCDATTALDLFQTAYRRMLDKAKFRATDVTFGSIVAGQREYDWAESDLRCYGVTWYANATSFRPLRPTSEDALQWRDPDWKDEKQLGTAVSILSDTAASPTVVTSAAAHGFLAANDGTLANQVFVHGLGGITDGYYFAKVTGYSVTTFGLYSDLALTVGVPGTGTVTAATMQALTPRSGTPRAFYTAARVDPTAGKTGKLVLGFDPAPDTTTSNGYPYAVCHCEEVAAISGSTAIPYSVLDEMYFVYAMCEFWAYEEDPAKAQLWERKRIQEESVQIEHLKGLLPQIETQILAPNTMFRRRVR